MRRRSLSVLLPIALLLLLTGCPGRIRVAEGDLRRVELREHGVEVVFPADWTREEGEFFHLSAFSPDEAGVRFEYRGLQQRPRDKDGKRRYALGWYQAIALSYHGWKYISQGVDQSDSEGSFRFEGLYLADGRRLRKMGVLRFRGNRVHALYYTAPEDEFERYRPLFDIMDRLHRYLPAESP
ncbi:MAG: hypothetical protein K1X75_10235 [Leptospirales bacterium]|nr:hypothetical protein [Leptospirales bacterium]